MTGTPYRLDHDVTIADGRLFLLSGPCVIESEGLCLRIAERLLAACARLGVPYVFKASFDKANRTSIGSFRGPGLTEGLKILSRVKAGVGVPILTDVHLPEQCAPAAEVADILQIPAFLCRQTDLLLAAARTGRVVNIKKGQFLAPQDMAHPARKVAAAGNERILLTERGVSFGYNNLVSDFRALPWLRQIGYPVVYDGTHSLQLPGGAGDATAGLREFIPHLCRAAVAVGCDGLFLEVHEHPDQALSDRQNALALDELPSLLETLLAIRAASAGAPAGART